MRTPGSALQAAREKQGRTLQEAAKALHIKKEYLAALEADAYETIPGAVFVKGFMRNYAQYLGVSAEKLVKEYSGKRESSKKTAPSSVANSRQEVLKKRNTRGKWPEITIIAGIVIFLWLIAWLLL
ncbi:RodZ family helix-turn-helix domain-containing protein [Megasphaera lornae]|jgi:conserved domain protein|uniref:HTH cro/C1-type domain-containing protein n=1 Tax=Megasphaera lornae TaxID=1000568 RepID=D3LV36_9FIRM|nr:MULTISPECIES: helix-turn-helix domain-containing protein [Megasphaera]EFD93964.1 hypothetical protein HMPREF0889_0368 [Megasphaera genomosp. type_1 str. 28L]EGL39857.1 hypothetical protein HMPREF1039_0380 [Megasphaera lornae]MUP50069.1 transcriptional regulator [Veillonellaceae bacterium M1-70]